jgi:hypothetical protein
MSELMYNEEEISLIKETFAENDALLQILRKLFYGLELTEGEKKIVKDTFKKDQVVEVLRRKVYGTFNLNTPIGHVSDFWMGVEQQIFGASRDTIYQSIESKKLIKTMFEKGFKLLQNPDGERVKLDAEPVIEADPLGIKMIARNLYLKAIETALFTVKTIAGKKEEKLEDTMKRLKQDSSK